MLVMVRLLWDVLGVVSMLGLPDPSVLLGMAAANKAIMGCSRVDAYIGFIN